MFDKLNLLNIPYSHHQKFFKNMEKFDFEAVYVQQDKFRDTDTTTWIGKHVPLSVSILSNLIEQPNCLCNSNPGALVESFVDALDGLTTQSKTQKELKFFAD